MRFILAFALVSSTVLVGSSASAQERGATAGQATSYDFDDDIVQGDLVRPDGEVLRARQRGARDSLLRIREHFVQEMLKSVENL